MLNLMYYFTVGKDEVRSWTIKKNQKAPKAASVIHNDFEKGFISAVRIFIYKRKLSNMKNSAKWLKKKVLMDLRII